MNRIGMLYVFWRLASQLICSLGTVTGHFPEAEAFMRAEFQLTEE